MTQMYLIKSQMTGMALTAEGDGLRPNSRVTPQSVTMQDCQLFYDDNVTGTIRVKSSNFCLDIEDGQLVVRPHQQGDPNQMWMRSDPYIRNRVDQNRVLDINGLSRERGAKVSAYDLNGGVNQHWTFEFAGQSAPTYAAPTYPPSTGYPAATGYPAQMGYPSQCTYPSQTGYPAQTGYSDQMGYPAQMGFPAQIGFPTQPGYEPASCPTGYPSTRQFFITSEMNGKVLDIAKGDKRPGAKVIMWDRKSDGSKNQLWYLDTQGNILSAFNDLALYSPDCGAPVTMQPISENPRCQWKFAGSTIVNTLGEVLDIRGESILSGAEVISYSYKNQKNQHWVQHFV